MGVDSSLFSSFTSVEQACHHQFGALDPPDFGLVDPVSSRLTGSCGFDIELGMPSGQLLVG